MRRKIQSHKQGNNTKLEEPHEVIKPLPRTFSKASPWLQGKFIATNHGSAKVGITHEACGASSWSRNWWETLLNDKGDNGKNNTCSIGMEDGVVMMDLWDEDLITSMTTKAGDFLTTGQTLSEFLLDVNLWDTEILTLGE